MAILSKFLNPKAKTANIVLAIVYIIAITALFIGAVAWQISLQK